MQIFSMQLKKTRITPPLGCLAEPAKISRPALTKAEHQEHSPQCNCLAVPLLFIPGWPPLIQLCIKYLMLNLKLWLIVFFFQLSSAYYFIHYSSHLFTMLAVVLLLAIRIVKKLLFSVQENIAIVTEAKLKHLCHEQGQECERVAEGQIKREICYFSFPRGLRKTCKFSFKKICSSPFPRCMTTWKRLSKPLLTGGYVKTLVSCMTNVRILMMSLSPLWITSVRQIIISH